ncbi:MAG: hypothetical protein HZA11_05190 [Nitrospirae bacterium]|nr:hypothetical protein [Nitrospirota bacterium]
MAEALLKRLIQGVKATRLRRVAEETRGQGVKKTKFNKDPHSLEPCNTSWGAIKYTKTAIYSSITDSLDILAQENKDTARLLKAGAENVLWVQSPAEGLEEVMPLAVTRLLHLSGIIIEGNSAIEFLKPDVVIFIFGRDTGTLKKSAVKILDMADIILFEEEPSVKLPVRKKKFKIALYSPSGLDECIDYIQGLLK